LVREEAVCGKGYWMIANTNEGTSRPPRMRPDINGSNIFGLPESSSMPKGDARAILSAVKAAGFEGVQTGSKAELCRELGLRVTGSGRIDTPEEADKHAADAKAAGYDCYTVHVGWGLEDDDAVNRLVEAVLRASEKHRVPFYIETHRATITQDIWRTVQVVKRFPEVRVVRK
jgi:sugar phosphate isomerase/epimerase